MTSPLMLLGALPPADPAPAPLPADDPALFAAALAAALALGPKDAVAPTQVIQVTITEPDGELPAEAEGEAAGATKGDTAATSSPTSSGTTLLGESAEPARPTAPVALPMLPPQDASGKPVGRQMPQARPSLEGPKVAVDALPAGVPRPLPALVADAAAPDGSNGPVAPPIAVPEAPAGKPLGKPTSTGPVTEPARADPLPLPLTPLVPESSNASVPASARAEAGQPAEAPLSPEKGAPLADVEGSTAAGGSHRNPRRQTMSSPEPAPATGASVAARVMPAPGGAAPVVITPEGVPAPAAHLQAADASGDGDASRAEVDGSRPPITMAQVSDPTPAPRPVPRPTRSGPKVSATVSVSPVTQPVPANATSSVVAALTVMPMATPSVPPLPLSAEGTSLERSDQGDRDGAGRSANVEVPSGKGSAGRSSASLRPLAAAFAQIVAELLADAPIREIRVQSVQSGEGKLQSDPSAKASSTDPSVADVAVTTDQGAVPVPASVPAPPRPAVPDAVAPAPTTTRNAPPAGSSRPEMSHEAGLPPRAPVAQLDAPVMPSLQSATASAAGAGDRAPLPDADAGLLETGQSPIAVRPEPTASTRPAIEGATGQDVEQAMPDRPRYNAGVAAADADAARSRRGEARRAGQPEDAARLAERPRGQQPARMAAKAVVDPIPTRLELPAPLSARAAEPKLPVDRQELPALGVDLTGAAREPEEQGPGLRERASDDARSASAPPASLTATPTRDGERPAEAPRGEARNLPRGEVSEERPAGNADRVTLQVIDQEGRSTRIRVAVLGQQIRAVIVPQDGEGGRHLEQRMDELHAALARQGFVDSRVTVQSSGTEQTTSWASPAANAPAAPGTSRGTDQPPGEQRQGSGRRDQGRQGDGQRHPQGRSRDREEDSRRR